MFWMRAYAAAGSLLASISGCMIEKLCFIDKVKKLCTVKFNIQMVLSCMAERKVKKCYVRCFREPISREIDITFLMPCFSLFLIFSSLSGP
jgi:hypothetical protein